MSMCQAYCEIQKFLDFSGKIPFMRLNVRFPGNRAEEYRPEGLVENDPEPCYFDGLVYGDDWMKNWNKGSFFKSTQKLLD